MLGEYGEAWFYPDFLFARPPIELMGASGFLGYTYTEAGERGRSWHVERKSWGKSPGKNCARRFVTSSPCKHQTLSWGYYAPTPFHYGLLLAGRWHGGEALVLHRVFLIKTASTIRNSRSIASGMRFQLTREYQYPYSRRTLHTPTSLCK